MAAANASARGQRAAIFASRLSELKGFNLTVDCLNPDCARERTFAVGDLASFYGGSRSYAACGVLVPVPVAQARRGW